MKWVRWWGVIAFIAVLGSILTLWFLLIDFFIERGIEKAGSELAGAEVDLARADLSLFPLGLTLTGLQVTDPENPSTNAFEAGRIAFTMDWPNLLMRKYIIEEMSVEGVKLHTKRKSPGHVKKKRGKKEEGPPLLTFEVPDVKEVMKKEGLASVSMAGKLKTDIDSDREKYQSEIKTLTDREKIKGYEERIDRLKKSGKSFGGILSGAQEALALQKDIDRDLKRVIEVKDGLEKKIAYYNKAVSEAAQAPGKDIARITEKYAFTGTWLSNLSRLFIGGKIREWVDSALFWRGRVEKAVESVKEKDGVEVKKPLRGKGVDVIYPERNPMPVFLVKRTAVSVSLPAGDLSGEITDMTDDQATLGKPMRFAFKGEGLKGLKSASLSGEMNRVVPASPLDRADLAISGYALKDFSISGSERLSAAIKEGLGDLRFRGEMRGRQIKASLEGAVKSARITTGLASNPTAIESALASAVSSVSNFNLKAGIAGDIDNYDLNLSSDMEKVLRDAAGKFLSAQTAEFEKKVRAEVLEKAGKPLEELQNSLGGFLSLDRELKDREDMIRSLLSRLPKGF